MKFTWQKLSAAAAVMAIAIPALYATTMWIATRASADELKQVSEQVGRTADAVEGLTLVVYRAELRDATDTLARLREEKRQHAATWMSDDEARLLEQENTVAILRAALDELIRAAAAERAALSEDPK